MTVCDSQKEYWSGVKRKAETGDILRWERHIKTRAAGSLGMGRVVWPLVTGLRAALVTGEQEKTE